MAIPTPFNRDDSVDYQGARNMVKLGLAHGITVFELTAGDSQYHVLSYSEIQRLTNVLVDAVGRRGTVIAATGAWWTARAIDYARFAETAGADGLQVVVPAGSTQGILDHYRAIADAVKIGLVLQGNIPLPVIEKLIAVDSIVAMKEDVTEKYYFDIQRRFGQRLAIFCGGQKWRYLMGQPYGSVGYLTTFGTFYPPVATRFWKAVERRDLDAAREIVLHYDQPFYDFCLDGTRPFHAWWRAFLEYFGVARRYLRRPEESCSDDDMKKVKLFCDHLGLTPSKEGRR